MLANTRKTRDAENNLQKTAQIPVQYFVQSFCAARCANAGAVIRAEFRAEKWQRLQKRVAEMNCRNRTEFATDRFCRKNGSDAENRAERRAVVRADDCAEKIAPMQKAVQNFMQRSFAAKQRFKERNQCRRRVSRQKLETQHRGLLEVIALFSPLWDVEKRIAHNRRAYESHRL